MKRKCPDYYMLADGRELADLLSHDIMEVIQEHVSHYTAHCICSALEHRYRRGKKEGEFDSDGEAESWWILNALRSHFRDKKPETVINNVLSWCNSVIDYERDKYSVMERHESMILTNRRCLDSSAHYDI